MCVSCSYWPRPALRVGDTEGMLCDPHKCKKQNKTWQAITDTIQCKNQRPWRSLHSMVLLIKNCNMNKSSISSCVRVVIIITSSMSYCEDLLWWLNAIMPDMPSKVLGT